MHVCIRPYNVHDVDYSWFSCALSRLTLVQKKSTNEPTPVFFYKLDVAVSLTSVVVKYIITVLG